MKKTWEEKIAEMRSLFLLTVKVPDKAAEKQEKNQSPPHERRPIASHLSSRNYVRPPSQISFIRRNSSPVKPVLVTMETFSAICSG